MDGTNEVTQEVTVDAAKIEADLVAEQSQKQQSPEEIAKYIYATYYKVFIEGIQHLSSRGRAKVLKSMVDWPFDPDIYKDRSKLEKNIMIAGNTLLEAKAILQLESFKGNIKQGE